MPELKEYPEYKPTGNNFMPSLPSHWQQKRIGFSTTKINSGKTPTGGSESYQTEGIMLIRSQNVYDEGLRLEDVVYIDDETHAEMRNSRVATDDVLLNITGASLGRCAVYDLEDEANVNQHVCILRPSKGCSSSYLQCVTISSIIKQQIFSLETGSSREGLNFQQISGLKIPFPPDPDEQELIARFLDVSVGKIDTLVSKKRELIDLLQEKRRALVSRCVTRGLPPDAARAAGLDPQPKLKPSGVDWLDDVPEHWDVVPLKHACEMIRDGTHLPPPRVDDGIPLLSVRNIVNDEFVNRSDDSMISEENYEQLCRSFVVLPDDVLLAIVGATLGKVAVVKEMPPFHIQRSLCVLRGRKSQFDHRFISYWCRSNGFQDLLWVSVGFSAQPGIYLSSINNFPILRPPPDEQEIIADYIERESGKLAALVERVERAIDYLLEYRSALITAAVTGKIDVREVEV